MHQNCGGAAHVSLFAKKRICSKRDKSSFQGANQNCKFVVLKMSLHRCSSRKPQNDDTRCPVTNESKSFLELK